MTPAGAPTRMGPDCGVVTVTTDKNERLGMGERDKSGRQWGGGATRADAEVGEGGRCTVRVQAIRPAEEYQRPAGGEEWVGAWNG